MYVGKEPTNVSLFVLCVTYVAYFLFSSSIASGIRMGVIRDKSSITILVSRVHTSMSCACAYATCTDNYACACYCACACNSACNAFMRFDVVMCVHFAE